MGGNECISFNQDEHELLFRYVSLRLLRVMHVTSQKHWDETLYIGIVPVEIQDGLCIFMRSMNFKYFRHRIQAVDDNTPHRIFNTAHLYIGVRSFLFTCISALSLARLVPPDLASSRLRSIFEDMYLGDLAWTCFHIHSLGQSGLVNHGIRKSETPVECLWSLEFG